MKRRNYKGRELLPLAVSDAAQSGDGDAVEQVLRYYEGYINKLSPRAGFALPPSHTDGGRPAQPAVHPAGRSPRNQFPVKPASRC